MKSKSTLYSTSTKSLKAKDGWTQDFHQHLSDIKKPFLDRVQLSKLQIQSHIQNFRSQKQALAKYEGIITCLIQKFLKDKLPPANQQKQIRVTQQSQQSTQKQNPIIGTSNDLVDDQSQQQNQDLVVVDSCLTQWRGRNKQRMFRNSTDMIQQYDRIFNKKIGASHLNKRNTYSYRKDQKQMLARIFDELKSKTQDSVSFEKILNFFEQCKLFLKIYGISPNELQGLVSSLAFKYSDKLTKGEFFQLFMVNSQCINSQQLQNKAQNVCCLDEHNWAQLKKLFDQLDTFGDGKVRTCQFFHKMKTISASKQLLQSNVLHFKSLNRHYTLTKILFDLQHKKALPQKISWSQLNTLTINFQHIEYPTIDEISSQQIQRALVFKDTNAFLLQDQTLILLKEQFQRCPKLSKHFVKCKYFCEELTSNNDIRKKAKQLVRNNPNGKGFVNLETNIRLLQIQGPEYVDLDQMLNYFSVRGFQKQMQLNTLKKCFDFQSTSSQRELEVRRRQEKIIKKIKSLGKMQKIMRNSAESGPQKKISRKMVFRPVKVQQFNLTKPRDHLTIREKRVLEMVEQKQRQQMDQIKPFVQANPIPASINCQGFLEQQRKNKAKRQLQRDRRQEERDSDQRKMRQLMSNTKLFQKRDPLLVQQQKKKYLSPQSKKKFEAKPISWFVKEKNLLQAIQAQKEERRKNRLKQTQQKYVFGYWKNMSSQNRSQGKKHTLSQNVEKSQDVNSLDLQTKQKKKILLKQEKTKLKTTIVPDFGKLQKQFTQDLQSKRQTRSPTVIRQFNLSASKKRESRVEQVRIQKAVSPTKRTKPQSLDNKWCNGLVVNSTRKFEDMVELNQLKIIQKQFQAHQREIQQKKRRKKQKKFAKFMRQALRQDVNKHKAQSQRAMRKVHSKSNSRLYHNNELRKIYRKVLLCPFLFQTARSSNDEKLQKQGINSKKGVKKIRSKRQIPDKIRIPVQEHQFHPPYPFIPRLQYIKEEDQQLYQNNYRQNQSCVDQRGQAQRCFYDDYEEQYSYQQNDKQQQQTTMNFNTNKQNLNQSF